MLCINHDAMLILAMRKAKGMPQLMQHQFLHVVPVVLFT